MSSNRDDQITVTVCSTNETACREVGEMFLRLARSCDPFAGVYGVTEGNFAEMTRAGGTKEYVSAKSELDKAVAAVDERRFIAPMTAEEAEQMRSNEIPTPDEFKAIVCPPDTTDDAPGVPAEQVAAAFAPHLQGHTIPPAPPAADEVPQVPFAGIPTVVPPAPAAITPPAPPVDTPPLAPIGVALDGEGLPWDQRIHASTKTFRQSDNTWKLKKGADATLVGQVKAELRTAMGAPVVPPPAPVTPPVVPVAPMVNETPVPPVNETVVPPAPVVPTPAAVTPPVPPAPAPPAAMTYPELVQAVTAKQGQDKISFMEVVKVCNDHGLANLQLLGSRPDIIPSVFAKLEEIWNAR
jgi:hypothetical protein